MRFARIGQPGHETPAVMVTDDSYVDITEITADIDGDFLARVDLAAAAAFVADRVASGLATSLGDQRVGSPIARPHQVLCIGLNYADHAQESGMAIPDEPIVFNKAPNTVIGPHDDVIMPRGSVKADWEVELGIVIGARARYLPTPIQAWEHVAGLVLVNDVSEREFQLERGGQWVKGKSCETFNPCGPWLVTLDEIDDVQDLDMWLDVNGQRMQTGTTSTMIFNIPFLVWYLSQFMVLEPGDLINTGTPPGVGLGMTPPTFLAVGDVMELGIDRLGTQRQLLIAAD
ncbi:MAG TPA: ureidoglycolate lyase [Actinobacteria bacterium]|nr:ureidoglycolate lyase [Actinomycetota bacterium]